MNSKTTWRLLLAAVAPSDPEMRRYLMFEAVSTLLAEASARTPLVLVLEDLHWADKPTLELLRHVVRAPDPAALLVVATYREADIDTRYGGGWPGVPSHHYSDWLRWPR